MNGFIQLHMYMACKIFSVTEQRGRSIDIHVAGFGPKKEPSAGVGRSIEGGIVQLRLLRMNNETFSRIDDKGWLSRPEKSAHGELRIDKFFRDTKNILGKKCNCLQKFDRMLLRDNTQLEVIELLV